MIIKDPPSSFFVKGDNGSAEIESIGVDENNIQFFNYVVTLKVDARNIIQGGITMAKMSIKNRRTPATAGMFDRVDGQDTSAVIDAVLNSSLNTKKEILTNDGTGVVLKKNIDLTTIVSNAVAGNLHLFSDAEAFGTKRSSSLKTPSSLLNPSNYPALQRSLSDDVEERVNGSGYNLNLENLSNVKNQSFSRGFKLMLNAGVDPGSSLNKKSKISTMKNSMEGTFPILKSSTGRYYIDQLRTAMITSIEGSHSNKKSIASYSSDKVLPILTVSNKRIKSLSIRFSLSSRETNSSSMLNIVVDMINSKGITLETKEFELQPRQHSLDFNVTDSDPMVRSSANESGSEIIKIAINDVNASGMMLFMRDISETGSLLDSTYSTKLTISGDDTRPLMPAIYRSSHKAGKNNRTGMLVFRAVQKLQNGLILGNFSSKTISRGRFLRYHCTIYTTCSSDSIAISVRNLPETVSSIEIMRRDLTERQKTYMSIYQHDFLKEKGLGSSSGVWNALDEASTSDNLVKDDHTYEYRCKLRYRNGVERLSSVTRIQKYIKPTGLSEVKISDVLTSQDEGTNRYSVSFSVSGEQIDSATDFLVEAIQSAGLSDLFQNDVEKIKDSLKNVIVFSIERFDHTSGETVNMGVFLGGEVLDNDPVMGPIANRKYTYRATALMRSPLELIEEIKASLSESEMTQSEINNPAARLSRSSSEELDPNFSDKFYSRSSFKRGTLSYGSALSESTAQDRFEKNPTGDFFEIEVDLLNGLPTVNSPMITQISQKGILVEWSVSGNSSIIDCFIVSSVRPDGRFIAGASHNVNSNGSYVFIDRDVKDYEGTIHYEVMPVMLDGNIGDIVASTSIVVEAKK
tara:strand:- start:242 stop:2812 length:2571 start_codon:yes stop_codon:yes gene_type:complete